VYAREQELSGGDYCGRSIWAARIAETGQYFPRDFNIVALSGYLTRTRDVGGAIAAAGGINTTSFNINYKARHDIALLAGQNIALIDGTVNGRAVYGTSLSTTRVTFPEEFLPHGGPYNIPGDFVDFAASKDMLDVMSRALDRYYPAAIVSLKDSGMTFVGTDPEINVFSVAASALQESRYFNFSVPHGAYVIINVNGPSPTFQWAGFSGSFAPERTLWNFPNATTLTIQGVGFMGSILAPNATGTFRWGSIRGTAVVAQAEAEVEMYDAPFNMPAVGGCLHRAPSWSCSEDTKIDDTGEVTELTPEAGFLEIPAESYVGEGHQRVSPTHRIWYSFHPAKTFPATRPLAVFFNGGPGAATSDWLFAFNTAPMTLDPTRTPGISPNEVAPWNEFANLLYIDAPGTGFSYAVADPLYGVVDHGLDMDRDAATFASVILRFLNRHPPLQGNQVIMAAESYGGARATLLLRHLFDYPTLTATTSDYQDSQLSADIVAYFQEVFGITTPNASLIATRFGLQVLLEPMLVGTFQKDEQPDFPPLCVAGCPDDPVLCDVFDCNLYRQPMGSLIQRDIVAERLNVVDTLNAALKTDARSIRWMYATERGEAYGKGGQSYSISTTDMIGAFGDLSNPDDAYFTLDSSPAKTVYGIDTDAEATAFNSYEGGAHVGTAFVRNVMDGVKTFITVSDAGISVRSEAIPAGLDVLRQDAVLGAHLASLVSDIDHEPDIAVFASPRVGWSSPPRVGMMKLTLLDGEEITVAMPGMYHAGHMITMRTPLELLLDVEEWYRSVE